MSLGESLRKIAKLPFTATPMKPAFSYFLVTLGSTLPLSWLLSTARIPVLAESAPPNATPSTVIIPTSQPTPSNTVIIPEFKLPPEPVFTTKEAKPSPTPTETKKPNSSESAPEKEPEISPEELARRQQLIAADRLYLEGKFAEAQKLYRAAKATFNTEVISDRQPPFSNPEELPPAGRVYWRQSGEGLEQKLETKIMVPLQFLVEQVPGFVPGHLRYAQALKDYNQPEAALQVLEKATTIYPDQPDLLKGKVALLAENKKWLEASVSARQFVLLNPQHPDAPQLKQLAEENFNRYRADLQERITGNAIANIITGALGFALTGSIFGPLNAIQTTALLLQGESAVGSQIAGQAQQELELIKDEEVLKYVRDLGSKLAKAAGREDFQYEFYVVKEKSLNAFALPGGKVFINTGAILKTNSEAELAGLLAHELSHAVLSHGFQLLTQGNLTANIAQFVPLGGTIANVLALSYSRDMEQQADILGTRLLAASGYAADGLRNLMITLNQEHKSQPIFNWLSSHPATEDRVNYLEELIQQNGYNRYSYEGVAKHSEIQAKLKKLLGKPKKASGRERNRQ